MPGTFKGCGRGIFGLKSWDPLPSPGQTQSKQTVRATEPSQPSSTQSAHNTVAEPKQGKLAPGKALIAKHSYSANQNSPIGHELSFTRGQRVRFKKLSPENDQWWLVESEDGHVGFVPASYMFITEDVKGLPWLQSAEVDEQPEVTPDTQNVCRFGLPPAESRAAKPFKPYVATYDLKGEKRGEAKFHCELCGKYFNGDIPYRTHLASRAHKEEEELAREYGNA